ncbi:MAG: DEAD/DEAH box helicase family protein [Cyclobacteriaceae bacterium]
MNESQTQLELITPAIQAAGWGSVEGSRILVEYPINQGRLIGHGQREKPLKADYILVYRNRRLAVVEAKKRDLHYTEGLAQAKDYAERLDIRFTYATNGLKIYQVDMEEAREGDVGKYPTPEELWNMTYPSPVDAQSQEKEDWKVKFDEVPFEKFKGRYDPRYFQRNAIIRVLNKIAEKKDRLLLTMATGTGKTATAFHICWKLFHAKWNLQRDGSRRPRVLFLADRNILANQAFNEFNQFDEDALVRIRPKDIRKKGKVPKNGSIFFTIFQTFMSGPNDSPYFGEYSRDFFDFIIIDECHRGGANDESTWRAIMEYFSPAVQLGLTATPKRDVNGDTYKYFGDPIYTYSLKEGINDGFLTPFKMVEVKTTIDEYTYTDDDEIVSGEIEEGRVYKESDFNRTIEIEEREEYRVRLFMDKINQNQKTLVFCATQAHAAFIRDLINQYAESRNTMYCVRVTANDGSKGEEYLKYFQDNERSIPTILTTSQKLSTGVDAPEVRNIVLLRPVKSMVEFKQIVGRGTRLFDGKDYFTIYDFVEAHQHFNDPTWDGEPLEPVIIDPRPPNGVCEYCGQNPCICAREPEPLCYNCGCDPCICEEPPKEKTVVKLGPGKSRQIDSMVKTTFWSPDGKPISANQFIKNLFGDIPGFFNSEEELRKIWSLPDTRKKLLEELSEKGYSMAQLEELSKLIHGEDSDLYDVLNYIAYHRDLIPRIERAERAKIKFDSYNPAQQEFLNFVLDQYVRDGVGELDDEKLPQLLTLKYNALSDAQKSLGDVQSIRNTFIGFQEYLYSEGA